MRTVTHDEFDRSMEKYLSEAEDALANDPDPDPKLAEVLRKTRVSWEKCKESDAKLRDLQSRPTLFERLLIELAEQLCPSISGDQERQDGSGPGERSSSGAGSRGRVGSREGSR